MYVDMIFDKENINLKSSDCQLWYHIVMYMVASVWRNVSLSSSTLKIGIFTAMRTSDFSNSSFFSLTVHCGERQQEKGFLERVQWWNTCLSNYSVILKL
jgi:hypothetical protein